MMRTFPEGSAIIYCEGMFATTNGKTAHGLVRRSNRYQILSVVDSHHGGSDAGMILENKHNGIPVYDNIKHAVKAAKSSGHPATHLVVGLSPDGGHLSPECREDVIQAIQLGLQVDSGLHDFLSEDPVIARFAAHPAVQIRDIR
jgi:uncharacterized NAD-dependent epimerase/dehydratase family protein